MASTQEKCYDPQDATLTFVDGEDDLDFLCHGYKSLRAKMSCGHAVTPMSLTDWCRRQLDQGERRFVCGQTGCDVEWPFEEVCKMALLTSEEKKYFEMKLSTNGLNVKLCPGCKCHVKRTDPQDLCVECPGCSAGRGSPYKFCWQCSKRWSGPAPRSDRCENEGCVNQLLEVLRNCPNITFEDVMGVTGCPSIRACPTCGLLIEHNKTQCKNMMCPQCKLEFCFVCLKLTEECIELIENQEYQNELEEELSADEEEVTDKSQDITKENEDVTSESQAVNNVRDELIREMEVIRDYCMQLTEESDQDSDDYDDDYYAEPHYRLCYAGVAPRQTSIPVWKRT